MNTTLHKIATAVMALAVTLLLGTGCASMQGGGLGRMPPGDYLGITGTDPALPAVLPHGEKLNVTVRYRIESTDEARIIMRPYYKGRQARGYIAHAAAVRTNGTGEVETWFRFRGDADVDGIRVSLIDTGQPQVLKSLSEPVDVKWRTAE
jgi:hypothetical protein